SAGSPSWIRFTVVPALANVIASLCPVACSNFGLSSSMTACIPVALRTLSLAGSAALPATSRKMTPIVAAPIKTHIFIVLPSRANDLQLRVNCCVNHQSAVPPHTYQQYRLEPRKNIAQKLNLSRILCFLQDTHFRGRSKASGVELRHEATTNSTGRNS